MSTLAIAFALDDRKYRGDARLLYIAAGDGNGVVGPNTAAYWLGVSEEEAVDILKAHVDNGMLLPMEDGRYYQPEITSYVEEKEAESSFLDPHRYQKKPISRHKRARIFDRDGRCCQYCNSTENLTVDHIIPEVRGGNSDDANLVTACKSCNSSKGTKSYDEFIASLKKERE